MKLCDYCKKLADLRPYGRKGALICFECAMKPGNKAETEQNFGAQLNACDVAMIDGTEVGPYPVKHHGDGKRIMDLLKDRPNG